MKVKNMTFCKTTLLAVSALVGYAALADGHFCDSDMMDLLEQVKSNQKNNIPLCNNEVIFSFVPQYANGEKVLDCSSGGLINPNEMFPGLAFNEAKSTSNGTDKFIVYLNKEKGAIQIIEMLTEQIIEMLTDEDLQKGVLQNIIRACPKSSTEE